MRFGVCQYQIMWEQKKENFCTVVSYFEQAKKQKVEMILLPEMSLTGFSMNVKKTRDTYENETISRFQKLCQDMKISAGFGWVEQTGDRKAHNHYTIVDERGNVLSDYTKIHPFTYGKEAEYFEGGDSLVACHAGEHKIATAICYDLRFPELFRILDKDCSVVVIPANWPDARKEHWNCLLQARAIENQIYVIGINCVGTMDGTYYSGYSTVMDPLGNHLAQIIDEEGLLIVDIPNNVERYRDKFPVRKDQRIEVMHKIGSGGSV